MYQSEEKYLTSEERTSDTGNRVHKPISYPRHHNEQFALRFFPPAPSRTSFSLLHLGAMQILKNVRGVKTWWWKEDQQCCRC